MDGVAVQLEHAVVMDGLRRADEHQTGDDQDADCCDTPDAAKPAVAETPQYAHLFTCSSQ
jgi:hypothetical protein